MVADLADPYILIHEKKLSTLQPMLPLLESRRVYHWLVHRSALRDAASVAGLLVTTEAMVAETPQKKDAAMPTDHGNVDY